MRTTTLLTVTLLVIGLAACKKPGKDKAKQKATEATEKIEMGVEKATDRAKDKIDPKERERLEQAMLDKARKADAKIAELKKRLQSGSKDAKEKLQPTLDNLEKKRAQLGEEMTKFKSASQDQWKSGKARVTNAFRSFESTLSNALKAADEQSQKKEK